MCGGEWNAPSLSATGNDSSRIPANDAVGHKMVWNELRRDRMPFHRKDFYSLREGMRQYVLVPARSHENKGLE
jgi:hypothetical protein